MFRRQMFLLLFVALVVGSFFGILVGGPALTSRASAALPAKNITKTFTIQTGVNCNYPYQYPTVVGDYPIGNYSDTYCVIDMTPLARRPVSMACVWTPVNSGTAWSGAWRNCYESYIEPSGAGVDVIWDSQKNQLDLLYSGGATPVAITVVYSAAL